MLRLAEIDTLSDEWQAGYLFVEEIRKFVHPMFAELLKEIREELDVAEHKARRHGSSGTNVKGCYGPLCKRARRLWWHSNYATKRAMAGKSYKPRPSAEQLLTEPFFELYQVHVNQEFEKAEAVRKLQRDIDRTLAKMKDSELQPTSAEPAEVPEVRQSPMPLASQPLLQSILL